MNLNQNAAELIARLASTADALRVVVHELPTGGWIIDFGVSAAGGLSAGRALAQVCLAGLGEVTFVPGRTELWPGPAVQVRTDHPVAACMASQYAGWRIAHEKYVAMGSGPMRAAAAREELFERIGYTETSDVVVGVLETRQLPPPEVFDFVADATGIHRTGLTICVAPTASQAGTIQVVARSIETALHKLFELGFDLSRVESGYGIAPLPPVAKGDFEGIGRTNDAILYGGEVTLWVRGDDDSLAEIAPQVPSSASPDHGEPFSAIFARYEHDFYKIDPHLFSPAVVNLVNVDTGRTFRCGELRPDVVQQSFSN